MTGKPILVNVRGVILQRSKVLLIKINDENGMHFTYPGATVRPGESLHDALKRGVSLQTSADVNVGRLLIVWEYIPDRENYRYGDRQRITLTFLCSLQPGSEPQMPRIADPNQIDVVWLPIDALDDIPVLPVVGKELAKALETQQATGNLFLNVTN
ncbi:MAG: NUDIX domain-containing protein [Anaerolineae bacterium]|jgi:ADP-ribose pyrophosphatase YjhB (NUDIX family)|nr:NUDIX domain-containing protein [Anaerolineae bacterium]